MTATIATLDELALGKFHKVLHDEFADPKEVTRALFCSGKIYFELAEERSRRADPTVAIIRVEKLYPWWPQLIEASIAPYEHLKEVVWVQDEPVNMGAGEFVKPRFDALLAPRGITCVMIARAESASPATGSHKAHVLEQQQILRQAFNRAGSAIV